MTIYDILRERYGSASPEEKLTVLRRELFRPIYTVRSAAEALKIVDDKIYETLPDDLSAEEFHTTIKWLTEAAQDIVAIVEALVMDSYETDSAQGLPGERTTKPPPPRA